MEWKSPIEQTKLNMFIETPQMSIDMVLKLIFAS